jgi:hypothetical protein
MGALGFGAAEGAAIPGSMTGGAKPHPCPSLPPKDLQPAPQVGNLLTGAQGGAP